MKFGLIGAPGKMATQVAEQAALGTELTLTQVVVRRGNPLAGQLWHGVTVTEAPSGSVDVWIEFAHPETTLHSLTAAVENRQPLLVCTTGLTDQARAAATHASRDIAVMLAPNTSLGVALLKNLLRSAVRAWPEAECEIVEVHHNQKRDAPSGTARALIETVRHERANTETKYERHGLIGPRQHAELGVFSLRGGDVIGDHTVFLFGQGERIELTHRASSRALFAAGALRAARWLSTQPAGLYQIEDSLGLGTT